MIDLTGPDVFGWVVGALIGFTLVITTYELSDVVRDYLKGAHDHMAMVYVAPKVSLHGLAALRPPEYRPPDTEVFALAATLRTLEDEFEVWLNDPSPSTFDEFCEETARRRLRGLARTPEAVASFGPPPDAGIWIRR